MQDGNATDDRLGRATNGAIDFLSEALNAATSTNILENFPEPRNFDGAGLGALQTHGNAFNSFFPWMLPESGGSEELLNHVGRHEISQNIQNSFTNIPALISFTNPATRPAFGIVSANTNFLVNFFQIAEDPRRPGTYFGIDAPDFSAGGRHRCRRPDPDAHRPANIEPNGYGGALCHGQEHVFTECAWLIPQSVADE